MKKKNYYCRFTKEELDILEYVACVSEVEWISFRRTFLRKNYIFDKENNKIMTICDGLKELRRCLHTYEDMLLEEEEIEFLMSTLEKYIK